MVQPMSVRITLAGGAAACRSSGTPRGKSLEIEGRLCVSPPIRPDREIGIAGASFYV